MKKNIKYLLFFLIAAPVTMAACKKTTYTFGPIKTPSNVVVKAEILGTSAGNPNGDGSGKVVISVTGTNALSYKILTGNAVADSLVTTTGVDTVVYASLGTNLYTITVNAIGTGGAITTVSKQVTVFYEHPISPALMSALTNGSSKNWVVAADMVGNFGVGPASDFTPDYYQAGPNEKPACAYAGVITFTSTGPNSISINDDNKGQSFLIAASTAFYGQTGGDGCYVINTGGTKPLTFSGATIAGDPNGNQFFVPGDGLVNFGTGGTTYQIVILSSTELQLRNIGIDGNAWYQILKPQ